MIKKKKRKALLFRQNELENLEYPISRVVSVLQTYNITNEQYKYN
jgi:hypothetical protein